MDDAVYPTLSGITAIEALMQLGARGSGVRPPLLLIPMLPLWKDLMDWARNTSLLLLGQLVPDILRK